ncbi:MAG: hypothetical protein JSW60_01150 [Thermoplasmatales archaeon]|nr:MAG: hypothetical protein JSW60_01150 [Thermoplasmatales archaeon]
MIKILVTVLGIILSVVFTVVATFLLTIRKIIRCIIVPSLSLVDVSKEVQDKTKISYNGEPVENLSSTTVKFRFYRFSGR